MKNNIFKYGDKIKIMSEEKSIADFGLLCCVGVNKIQCIILKDNYSNIKALYWTFPVIVNNKNNISIDELKQILDFYNNPKRIYYVMKNKKYVEIKF